MQKSGRSAGAAERVGGIRVLVAEDAAPMRFLLGSLLRATEPISAVLETADGAAAVDAARDVHVDIAVLDLHMPRLDGVAAARMLHALEPSMPIALYSSDPLRLHRRAHGLELRLFDKLELRPLVDWVAGQALLLGGASAGRIPRTAGTALSCRLCGYGIVSDAPPIRCPMCHAVTAWAEAQPARDAAAHAHVTG